MSDFAFTFYYLGIGMLVAPLCLRWFFRDLIDPTQQGQSYVALGGFLFLFAVVWPACCVGVILWLLGHLTWFCIKPRN